MSDLITNANSGVYKKFKQLFETRNFNYHTPKEEITKYTDELFSYAEKLSAKLLMRPTYRFTSGPEHDQLTDNYFYYICAVRPEHALEIIDRLSTEQISERSGYRSSPLSRAIYAISEELPHAKDLAFKIIQKSSIDDLKKSCVSNYDDLQNLNSKLRDDKFKTVREELVKLYETKLLEFYDKMTPDQFSLTDNYGSTDLHWASSKDHTTIALSLIEKMTPEQIALQNKNGDTALHNVRGENGPAIALAMIEKMTLEQITLQNKNGTRALDFFNLNELTKAKYAEVIKAYEAKLNGEEKFMSQNINDSAPLTDDEIKLAQEIRDLAFSGDNSVIAQIKQVPQKILGWKDYSNYTTLMWMMQREFADITLVFIERMTPEQLSLQDVFDETALLKAAKMCCNTNILLALIGKMPPEKIRIKNLSGEDALAILESHPEKNSEAIKAIREKLGENDNALLTDEEILLAKKINRDSFFVRASAIESIRAAPQRVLGWQDNDGKTNLHQMSFFKYIDILNELLKHMTPEQIGLKDKRGRTALDIAIFFKHKEIETAIKEKLKGVKIMSQDINDNAPLTDEEIKLAREIFYDCKNRSTHVIAKIQKAPQKVLGWQNNEGDTALLWAAIGDNTVIALALIDKMTPKQIALQDKHGNTALIMAARFNLTNIVLALIEKMTPEQIAIKNKNSNAALDFANEGNNKKIQTAIKDKLNEGKEYKLNKGFFGFDGGDKPKSSSPRPPTSHRFTRHPISVSELTSTQIGTISPPPPPIVNFKDNMAKILTAVREGNAVEQDAFDFSGPLMKAAARLFTDAQRSSLSQLNNYNNARRQVDELSKALSGISRDMHSVQQNPQKLLIPNGMHGKVVTLVRETLPMFDPVKQLDTDFQSIHDGIETAQKSQEGAINSYANLKDNFSQYMAPLKDMDDALQSGITELESMKKNNIGDSEMIDRLLYNFRRAAHGVVIYQGMLTGLEGQGNHARDAASKMHSDLMFMGVAVSASAYAVTSMVNTVTYIEAQNNNTLEAIGGQIKSAIGAIEEFQKQAEAMPIITIDSSVPDLNATILALPAPRESALPTEVLIEMSPLGIKKPEVA